MKLQLLVYWVVLRPRGNFTLIEDNSEVNFRRYFSEIKVASLLTSAVWSECSSTLREDYSQEMVTLFFPM
jgi:hypothetical protein